MASKVDFKKLREDFPILKRKVNGKALVYLDSAATSQKPKQVLNSIVNYYQGHNANVHRGIHTISVEATEMMENAREKVAKFVGARDKSEIIFVKNATEAINLIAYAWGRLNVGRGDEIVLTIAEHHSNFVPWQQLVAENGATLKIVPVLEEGTLDEEAFKKALTKKTKLVTFFHVSNVLGTINDVSLLSAFVRRKSPKAKVLIDGAQAVPHMPVDVSKFGCDFYVFTGHKMLGPTGIGVLWGRRELLVSMSPFLFGGEMISKVSVAGSTWNDLPWKFEAGTPNIEGAIGLGAAVDYLNKIGISKVRQHEIDLITYAISELKKIKGVTLFGPADFKKRGGVVSFNVDGIHAHDVASILDSEGIAIRSGQHCAEPLMDFLNVPAVARASFYVYNTKDDVDKLVDGINKVKEVFKV